MSNLFSWYSPPLENNVFCYYHDKSFKREFLRDELSLFCPFLRTRGHRLQFWTSLSSSCPLMTEVTQRFIFPLLTD